MEKTEQTDTSAEDARKDLFYMKQERFKDFASVQKELKVITKNVDGFKHRYADLDRVWDKVQPVLSKHGFNVLHYATTDGFLATLVEHRSGLDLPISYLKMKKEGAQERGGEITYYRRYNILMLFNVIVSGEDTDAAETPQRAASSQPQPVQAQKSAPMTEPVNVPMDEPALPFEEGEGRYPDICPSCNKGYDSKGGKWKECFGCSAKDKVMCKVCGKARHEKSYDKCYECSKAKTP